MENYRFYTELGQLLGSFEAMSIISKPQYPHTRVERTEELYLMVDVVILADPHEGAAKEVTQAIKEICDTYGADCIVERRDIRLSITIIKAQ